MRKIFLGLVIILMGTIVVGCGSTASNNNNGGSTSTSTSYSLTDVAKHNSPSDCWTAIDGNVYDVTAYVQSGQHPGGPSDQQACGIDATQIFSAKHSPKGYQVLSQYQIGILQ